MPVAVVEGWISTKRRCAMSAISVMADVLSQLEKSPMSEGISAGDGNACLPVSVRTERARSA